MTIVASNAHWRAACIAVLAALSLTACEATKSLLSAPKEPPPCPRLAAVTDAAHLTRFNGPGRDLTDVLFEAEIGEIRGNCIYRDRVIDMEMAVQFIASRGPADAQRRADFGYFVAVARTDREIAGRDSFTSFIEFPGNQTRAGIVEELEPQITLREGETGAYYVVFVGFQLTREELEFNRQQQR